MSSITGAIWRMLSVMLLSGLLLGFGGVACTDDPSPGPIRMDPPESIWDTCESNPFHECGDSFDCKCGEGLFTCDTVYDSPYSPSRYNCAVWGCRSDSDCDFLTDGRYPKCELQSNPQLQNYCRKP